MVLPPGLHDLHTNMPPALTRTYGRRNVLFEEPVQRSPSPMLHFTSLPPLVSREPSVCSVLSDNSYLPTVSEVLEEIAKGQNPAFATSTNSEGSGSADVASQSREIVRSSTVRAC